MLADLIHKLAEMENAKRKEKAYYPRPSMAGPERCLRQTVYSAMGIDKKPLGGRAITVFDDSSWHEELTADWLRNSVYEIHSEQMSITIKDVFDWMPKGVYKCTVEGCGKEIPYTACHGHIDWITTDLHGVDRLTEHKALSHFGFEKLLGGAMPYDYFTQEAIYMRGLQQDNPELSESILLVKNKNQSGYLEFRSIYINETDTMKVIDLTHHTGEVIDINLDIPNITNNAFDNFREVEKHRKAGTLPNRQYDIDHWRCDYCPFNKTCWKGYVEEHEQLTSDVALQGEIVDLLKLERENAMHESRARKEKETLRGTIKGMLSAAGVRSGRAGDYSIDWVVTEKNKFNKELLPPGMYNSAIEVVPGEKLTIRRAKKKEE